MALAVRRMLTASVALARHWAMRMGCRGSWRGLGMRCFSSSFEGRQERAPFLNFGFGPATRSLAFSSVAHDSFQTQRIHRSPQSSYRDSDSGTVRWEHNDPFRLCRTPPALLYSRRLPLHPLCVLIHSSLLLHSFSSFLSISARSFSSTYSSATNSVHAIIILHQLSIVSFHHRFAVHVIHPSTLNND